MTDISDVQVAVGLDGRHIDGRMTSGEASPRTRINALRSRFRPAGRNVLLWSGAVGLTILLQWPWLVLYLDIRYTFGALRTSGQVGPATDIFIHRPMANRLLMSWLDHLTFGPTVLRERLTLSIAILFAGLAGAGLARSLRRWTSAMGATSVGLATFTALAWAPTVTVLQPEWTAALLSVAAISVGLARGPRWVVSWHSPLIAGAGLLLAVAALQKYTTATTVIVALGLLFVLHRRRAWMVAGWTAVLTALLFGLTLLNQHEWQWFRDMPRLSPTDRLNWRSLGLSLWNLAWLNPILMFWPAAIILGYRLSRRRSWIIGCALAILVLQAGVTVQNGFFPYHYGALSVLAAGLVTFACGQWWQRTGTLPCIALVGLIWIPLAGRMARQPYEWRVEHVEWAVTSVGVVTVVSASLALWQAREHRVRRPQASGRLWTLVVAASVLALVISFPAWSHTPYANYSTHVSRASEIAGRARAMEVGQEIRKAAGGSSVVYLARPDAPYFVALSTNCRYPTATFLYRSARTTDAASLVSLQENLACLRDPAATFLVLQPAMIDPSRAVPLVRDTVAAHFDCRRPTIRAGSFILCPRR